jgi:hypothetical protein
MSYTDFEYFKNSTVYNIVFEYKDTSFDIGQLCDVPGSEKNQISITYDVFTDIVKEIEHYNDLGENKDFTTIPEVIEYVKENYIENDNSDSLEKVIEILQELDELQKPKTADSMYKKAIGYAA